MNAMSSPIEQELMRNSIPYRIIGGHKFYDRMEIKDAMAYLSVINNTSDKVRLMRIINTPEKGNRRYHREQCFTDCRHARSTAL